MNAFFVFEDGTPNIERVAMLQREAGRWVGTPFAAHSMIRGAGVDCVHLAAALYLATKAVDDFRPPPYSLDGGHHNQESTVTQWLDKHPRFACIDRIGETFHVKVGDLLCFKFGMSEHHTGVMLEGPQFIHAPINRKVVVGSLTDPVYRRTLKTIYRPIQEVAA